MDDQIDADLDTIAREPEDLDGYTIDDLADYLDAGRHPYDPVIESSPACRHALAALERLRVLSADLLTDAVPDGDFDDDAWLERVMSGIARNARNGADFVLTAAAPDTILVMTEGALRALIRAGGDHEPGFLVGRIRFAGDLSEPAGAITIAVDVTVAHGLPIPDAVERLRTRISSTVLQHTEFQQLRVDVTVEDLAVAGEDTP